MEDLESVRPRLAVDGQRLRIDVRTAGSSIPGLGGLDSGAWRSVGARRRPQQIDAVAVIGMDAQSWGIWDDQEHGVGGSRCQEDLVNATALETVRHGGRAFVISPFKLPIESGVAASLRY